VCEPKIKKSRTRCRYKQTSEKNEKILKLPDNKNFEDFLKSMSTFILDNVITQKSFEKDDIWSSIYPKCKYMKTFSHLAISNTPKTLVPRK